MQKSFTLAEVLITLGIIGIVAAMTLPPLIQRQQEKVAVAELKKAYSTISQAYLMAVNEHGSPENWDLKGYATRDGALQLLKILTPYMKITKICDVKRDCFPNVQYKTLNPKILTWNHNDTASADAKLNDGSLIAAFIWTEKCNTVFGTSKPLQHVCAEIQIDINGFKKPNQVGIDYFSFMITPYGVIPNGVQEQTSPNNFANSCRDKDRGANGWSANGDGCAAWVIYNENMDYLRCKDLSWTGKRKCSD